MMNNSVIINSVMEANSTVPTFSLTHASQTHTRACVLDFRVRARVCARSLISNQWQKMDAVCGGGAGPERLRGGGAEAKMEPEEGKKMEPGMREKTSEARDGGKAGAALGRGSGRGSGTWQGVGLFSLRGLGWDWGGPVAVATIWISQRDNEASRRIRGEIAHV